MRILRGKAAEACVKSLELRGSRLGEVEPVVQRIVDDVRKNGDRALLKYARKFDGLGPRQGLRVGESEMKAAWKNGSTELKSALEIAARRIRQFCEWQRPQEWIRSADGISLGQVVRPLESVG